MLTRYLRESIQLCSTFRIWRPRCQLVPFFLPPLYTSKKYCQAAEGPRTKQKGMHEHPLISFTPHCSPNISSTKVAWNSSRNFIPSSSVPLTLHRIMFGRCSIALRNSANLPSEETWISPR